jgi:hypothetical protein
MKETLMRRIILAALITCFMVGSAAAQSCDSQAVSATGKPLHGAARADSGHVEAYPACRK